jgi:hypothetical protein
MKDLRLVSGYDVLYGKVKAFVQSELFERASSELQAGSPKRTCFYKYVTVDTVKKILQNGTLQWSSPMLFNDPFDLQFDLHMEYDAERVVNRVLQRFVDVYMGRVLPVVGVALAADHGDAQGDGFGIGHRSCLISRCRCHRQRSSACRSRFPQLNPLHNPHQLRQPDRLLREPQHCALLDNAAAL